MGNTFHILRTTAGTSLCEMNSTLNTLLKHLLPLLSSVSDSDLPQQETKTGVSVFPCQSLKGFVSRAANLVLLRVMAWQQSVPSGARFLALDSEGKLCYCTYVSTLSGQGNWPDIVVQYTWEGKAGESGVQSHPRLHVKSEVSPAVRLSQKKTKGRAGQTRRITKTMEVGKTDVNVERAATKVGGIKS